MYKRQVFGFFGLFWILVGFFFIKGGDKKAMAHFCLCGLILCIGFTIRAFQDGLVWPLGIDLVVIDVLLLTLIPAWSVSYTHLFVSPMKSLTKLGY